MMTQSKQHAVHAQSFLELHRKGQPFILANAWNVGTAKMLAASGAKAIGTSSSAFAFTLGRLDNGATSREESIAHAAEIAEAVNVPVSADLEHGYGDDPDSVYQTIRQAIEAGLAGACIEDVDPQNGRAYPADEARYRIDAAIGAISDLEASFVLTARADGVMHGLYDLGEAIARIQRFEKSGAQAVFVPMPDSIDDLAKIAQSVSCPVNVIAAGQFLNLSLDDFAKLGVARVSLGSSLARCVQRTISDKAKTVLEDRRFDCLTDGMPGSDVDAMLTMTGAVS